MLSEAVKTVEMKEYYKHRKIIQQLYHNDVIYGDLAGVLLGIREQVSSIDSMSLEIQSYRIRVELVQDENKKYIGEIGNIFDRISAALNNFISDNIDKVTDQETANSIKEQIMIGMRYFDCNHVGNMLEINL